MNNEMHNGHMDHDLGIVGGIVFYISTYLYPFNLNIPVHPIAEEILVQLIKMASSICTAVLIFFIVRFLKRKFK